MGFVMSLMGDEVSSGNVLLATVAEESWAVILLLSIFVHLE
jgi:hypothetical protein